MNAEKALLLLREIRDVAFATVSPDGKPQVRIIDVMLVEDGKLYFCTARGKDFYEQLLATGEVAIAGLTKDFKDIRLSGSVRKLPEQKLWIDRIFEANPGMNEVYPGGSRYILEAFCVEEAEIKVFDLGVLPIERESFVIGSGAVSAKGFEITDSCIGCGTCAANCPQQAIDEGTPFAIRQKNCLHCGFCYENCPVQAIVKRAEA